MAWEEEFRAYWVQVLHPLAFLHVGYELLFVNITAEAANVFQRQLTFTCNGFCGGHTHVSAEQSSSVIYPPLRKYTNGEHVLTRSNHGTPPRPHAPLPLPLTLTTHAMAFCSIGQSLFYTTL